MPRVIWTNRALNDLDRLEQFLWTKSPLAAERAIRTILEATRLLEDFPQAGRPAADLDPEHRELPVPFSSSGYVVLYGYDGAWVEILFVRHMREDDFPSLKPS